MSDALLRTIGRDRRISTLLTTSSLAGTPRAPPKLDGGTGLVEVPRLSGAHDGIDSATYGDPDGTPNPLPDRFPASIDLYGNDFSNMADNCIEADGGARNIRVFENRCFNSAQGAFSAQPIFGGPVYFYRNLVYDAVTAVR